MYYAIAAVNLGLIALTAFAIYHTGSLWSLLILFFVFGGKSK